MSSREILLQATSAPATWRSYYELTKPKVVLLITFTAMVGMLLSVPGWVPWQPLLFGTLGIALAAASGAAINQLVEERIDARMERTRNRPLPTGRLDSGRAFAFAALLAILSMAILISQVNLLTALLTFLSLIGYAVIYTLFLKRNTPQNIVWGGAAGAAPPLLGWAAVTGEVTLQSFLLFLIIFIWTPPHFWPLAIRRREEYARAGLPMLPVTHGVAFTKLQVLLYSGLLFAVTLLPFAVHMAGYLYLAGAVILGLGFIHQAWRLYRSDSDQQAMQVFGYSIAYLAMLFGFLLVDHYLIQLLA
ncbi:MAG: heme o synthase [Gammaproteobacteria bacterium]